GHGLNLQSTPAIADLPEVSELHIGHALIGHAVFVGLTQSVRDFQATIARAVAAARAR
ncbi:MAG: pyridoxine 5'-phosphate synthase, partial [Burkholderiaceae bacterium]|nr:pyridoxine 5'-phosphate synthase [Burkholderiaceae bacterium]